MKKINVQFNEVVCKKRIYKTKDEIICLLNYMHLQTCDLKHEKYNQYVF